MSLGGQNLTDEDIRRYIAMQSAAPAGPAPAPMPYNDPTFLAQQAILARPMRPSFTGQQLMSREVPVGLQGNSGLAYPSMQQSGLLNVPSYTSRYAGTDSGGGGGGLMQTGAPSRDQYSLSNGLVASLLGLSAVPNAAIPVENMGTYANMPGMNDFGVATQAEANAIAEAQNAQAMQSMQDAMAADTSAANGGDSGGYGTGDSAGFGGGTDSGSDGW